MKMLITGGTGLLGSCLKKIFPTDEVSFTYHSHPVAGGHWLDVSDRSATLSLISTMQPDITIHTVAVPSMDVCETNKSLAERVNIEGTRNVIDACLRVGSKIVYISTPCVFDGTKAVFTEDSPTNPINYYGITKLEGEKIVARSGLPFLIMRTDQPYGWIEPWQKKNSVVRALEVLDKDEEFREVVDWYNNPTYGEDFAAAAKQLIEKKREGIFHVVGPDYLNRYEWALRMAEVFGKDATLIKPINSQMLRLNAKRINAKLNTDKLAREGIKMAGVWEGLRRMKAVRERS
ncbi:SDR family oxidoreductase [Candidatus Parcubacteria bacterium]|nr:SDR family oxidoreductase [Candidatus Parcubacteria bacterium]